MATRETKAVITLSNLKHNLEYYRQTTQKEVFSVVKANAYGHGDVKVAKYLEAQGIKLLCVSSLDEALQLKEAGIKADILIFSYVNPLYVERFQDPQFIFTIVSKEWFDSIKSMALNIRTHLKINTGMNRVGVKKLEDVQYIMENSDNVIEGIYTHYSSSDSSKEETKRQATVFTEIVESLNYDFKWIHASNTHGVDIDSNLFNAVRVGIGLYGYEKNNSSLKPVLTITSQVINLETIEANATVGYNQVYRANKEEIIATLPIGYADGFDIRNKTVIINNKSYPIVGKICMDQCMVKVDETVTMLDPVEVLSNNRGYTTIEEETGIMPYIIMTSLSPRVVREYIE